MATLTKFTSFYQELMTGGHDLHNDTIKAFLTNTLPLVAQTVLDTVTNHPPPAATDGYTTTGHDIQNVCSGGIMTGTDILLTAGAGGIGAFQYVLLVNTSKTNKLIGFYTYPTSSTLLAGEKFNIDFNPAGILSLP